MSDPLTNHFGFRAAQGWLELGCPADAAVELAQLPPELKRHPDVLRIQFHVERMLKRFPEALAVADSLIAVAPDDKWGWLYRSHALHWLGRSIEAYDLLEPLRTTFPDAFELPYDLACYCAQTERVDEARHWLSEAFRLGKKSAAAIEGMALDDQDLKPLWEDIRKRKLGNG
ncbi:MAG TPA: tetratricopeptide repeat protein [Candidatus Limnocylindria bacterium]|nr:tetratricopeptide repeat protein [Candidatus Limnocylindria bacterium]